MIRVPRYQEGDSVNISTGSGLESVKVLATTISLETQEVYYKVCLHNKTEKEFIVSEDEVITGYYSVPIPAFAVGDVITFDHQYQDASGSLTNEVRSGVIETVNITWSEEGWYIYYKTDEHMEGEYVMQDDIIDSDIIDDSLEEEKRYGAV